MRALLAAVASARWIFDRSKGILLTATASGSHPEAAFIAQCGKFVQAKSLEKGAHDAENAQEHCQ